MLVTTDVRTVLLREKVVVGRRRNCLNSPHFAGGNEGEHVREEKVQPTHFFRRR